MQVAERLVTSETSKRVAYTFGPYHLDAKDRVLRKTGEVIPLTPKAAETLLVLVENAGHVVAKEILLQRVWPDTFVEESTLAQNILTLRKALGKQATGQDYIGTVPKRGYRFEAPVVHEPLAPSPQTLVQATPALPHSVPRRFSWVAAAVIATLLAGSLALGLRRRSPPPAPVTAIPSAEKRARLAVLPFVNLGGDPAQDYLSDGFTEEMITQIGQLNPEHLTVIARTSAMLYRGTKKDTHRIGEELGVDYLLDGSVRREGKRIRVSAQLIRVSDQSNLWAANYDRELRNILELQSQVARSIAGEIAVKIAPERAVRLESVRSVDPDAYELYLEGRHFWNRRTPEGIEKAIQLLRQAIARDPGWARAHAALADCFAVEFIYSSVSARELLGQARAESRRALDLDPTLAEAHATLAYAYFYDWDFPAAEKEFQKSFEDNPRYATAHQWYGELLRQTGRQDEAIQESKRALELDPLSPIINVEAALPYYYRGEYEKAAEQLRHTVELDPYFASAHGHLAMVYEQQGRFAEALQESQAAQVLGDAPWIDVEQGVLLARMGRKAEAQKILKKMLQSPRQFAFDSASIALLQIALGQREKAVATLERAYREHMWQLTGLRVDPRFRAVLGDPRVQQILRGIGFPS